MRTIKLDCGRDVWIDGINIERSTSGYLEGAMARIVDAILKRKPRRMTALWGERATHLIRPGFSEIKSLPRLCVHVWLISNHSSSPEADGTELVVAFFINDIERAPITELVEEHIKGIDWDRLSSEFCY